VFGGEIDNIVTLAKLYQKTFNMNIALLGTGLIGTFYCMSLHGLRSRDKVTVVYSRSAERGAKFAAENNIPK